MASDIEQERAPGRLARAGRVIAATWQGLRQFVFGVLPVAGIAALLFLLAREMRRDDIEVAPIAVPAKLAEAGLAPEVVALRQLDQLEATVRIARAESVERPTTELAGAQPDFNVPIAGLSLRSTAQLLRRVLGYQERRVTGEVILEPNDQLSLRLRLSGFGQIADLRGYSVNAIDTLLRDAAPLVWRPLQPRLYAWWVAELVENQQDVRDRLADLRSGSIRLTPEGDRTVTFLIARSLVRSGNARAALPMFDDLVVRHPGWPGSWSGRALALAALNQSSKAVEDLRKAIDIDRRWVAGHGQLSRLLRVMGRPAEALAAAEAAAALEPNDISIQMTIIESLRDLRRLDEARDRARQLTIRHPRNADVSNALGWVLLRTRDNRAALEVFEAALVTEPRHAGLLSGRAETLVELNRLDDALAAIRHALSLHPRAWSNHAIHSGILRRLSRCDEALNAADRAVQLAEGFVWPVYGRAMSLACLGRRDDAIAELQRLIEMDTSNLTNARADLARLQARR